jgi:hypothetical protein
MSRPAVRIRFHWMRRAVLLAAMFGGASIPVLAQYPGHIKKDADTTPTLRATGVFEWTGDFSKPKAGRLIPVAVWDGKQYQPGGLYLAQPAPITVYSGTVYELQQAGAPRGLFQVNGAENLGGSWIAVGSVKPEVIVAKVKPPMSKHPPQVVKDAGSDSDRPTLHRKDGSDGDSSAGSGSASSGSSDPDRPTLHRKDSGDSGSSSSQTSSSSSSSGSGSQTSGGNGSGSGSGSGNSSGSTASTDSSAPTLHRRDAGDSSSSSGSSGDSGSGSSSGSASDDPDRPTLHRRDSGDSSSSGSSSAPNVDPDRPTLRKRTDKASNDTGAPVSATASNDPDRPKLRYGKPETLEGIVAPSKLEGLPMDMNQMAAISDVKQSESHTFAYSWADSGDAAKMQTAMEDLARKALAGKQAKPQSTIPSTTTTTKTVPKTTAARRKAAAQPVGPVLELEDEKFNAFELSYNGGATLVFTAKNTGDDKVTKYVTVIAQPDFYGLPQTIFQQVTNDERLEITPSMHLVDAVDTDADHRAELIFELRGKTGRAFAIYRVVNRKMDEAFNTGPLP